MSITCAKCGRAERDDDATFCSGCGAAFSKADAPAVAVVEAEPKPKKKKKQREADPEPEESGPFCAACRKESSDDTAGEVSEGFLFGRSFWLSSFGARRCDKCGSEVRTLWNVVLGVPLTPIASYRYKLAEGSIEHRRWRFHSRRLPELEHAQIRTTRILSLIMVLIVAGLIYWKHYT